MVNSSVVFIVLLVNTRKQVLILLTYLFNVLLEESPLDIVSIASCWSVRHLLKRRLFSSYVLSGLEVIQPP